ncbi:hypothetical protein JCM10207_004312 [Rhodosporidiobolus poonsookiae]
MASTAVKRNKLASTKNKASSSPSLLLRLPTELLDYIFELATVEYPLRGLLCKILLPFYRRHQWSLFEIRSFVQLDEARSRVEQQTSYRLLMKAVRIADLTEQPDDEDFDVGEAVRDFLLKLTSLADLHVMRFRGLRNIVTDLPFLSSLPSLRRFDIDCWPTRPSGSALRHHNLSGITTLTVTPPPPSSFNSGVLQRVHGLTRLILKGVEFGPDVRQVLEALPSPAALKYLKIDGSCKSRGTRIGCHYFQECLQRFTALELELSGSIELIGQGDFDGLSNKHLILSMTSRLELLTIETLSSAKHRSKRRKRSKHPKPLKPLKRLSLNMHAEPGPSAEECKYDRDLFEEAWSDYFDSRMLTVQSVETIVNLARKSGIKLDGTCLSRTALEDKIYRAELKKIYDAEDERGKRRNWGGDDYLPSDDEDEERTSKGRTGEARGLRRSH